MLDKEGDYLWHDVFPNLSVVGKNALDLRIDVGTKKRFNNYQFSSIGSGNAGKVRAQHLLYMDDLVSGLEEAMSPDRLEKLWGLYTTDARQRKEGDCRELMIATRWSVHDPQGHVQSIHEGEDDYRFIEMPALDENDESNFNYGGGVGFTTEFYHDIRDTMDEVSWNCLYMSQPIEREGILYNKDELRYYYELPSEEPDAIIGVCDTANGGGDSTCLPVFYVYGNDHYLVDVVFNNGSQELRDQECINILLKHNVQQCRFESNNAGGRTADIVDDAIQKAGGKCSIQKKYTTTNKETKIIVNSPFIKEHVLFKDWSRIPKGSEYQKFIKEATAYTQMGKNKHDDAVDALAQYALFCENFRGARATVMKRVF